jgi:hypothetical protein
MGWACSWDGREEERMQDIVGKARGKGATRDQDVDG